MPPAFHKLRGIEVWRMEGGGKLAKRWNPHDTCGKEEWGQVDAASVRLARPRF